MKHIQIFPSYYSSCIVYLQCISVCLSNILAKQIDHQRYLLEREARRCERRRRRNERIRFRDPYTTAITITANEPKRSTGALRHSTGQTSDGSATAIDVRRFFLSDSQFD